MNGVRIKIFYGYTYYDEAHGIEKTGYDYEIIGDKEPTNQYTKVYNKLRTYLRP